MKLKTKLISLCLAFAMVVGVLMVGVFAIKSTNFTLGGNISFSASGINATVSDGVMTGGTWVSGSADTKMQGVTINTNKTQTTLDGEFSSWSGLDLAFNDAGEDVTIKFSVTNNSQTAGDYIVAYINIDNGTAKNASATVKNSGAVINPDTDSSVTTENVEEFEITFMVFDKQTNASLQDFGISVRLEKSPATATASTSTSVTANNITFSIGENNTLKTTGLSGSPTELVIPSHVVDGETVYTVTTIGEFSFADSSLTAVFIPETVTVIENTTFASCDVTTVTLPSSISFTGSSQFSSCSNMKTMIISEGITSIPSWTGTLGFESLIIPASLTSIDSFWNLSNLEFVKVMDGNTVYEDRDCHAVIEKSSNKLVLGSKNTIIPSTVTTIGEYAFTGMYIEETHLVIPSTVTTIEAYAFRACTGIKTITLSKNSGSIENVFSECTGVTDVYFDGDILEFVVGQGAGWSNAITLHHTGGTTQF